MVPLDFTVKKILRDCKGQKILTETLPFLLRASLEEAGIDTMKARFDLTQPELKTAIRKATLTLYLTFPSR